MEKVINTLFYKGISAIEENRQLSRYSKVNDFQYISIAESNAECYFCTIDQLVNLSEWIVLHPEVFYTCIIQA